MNIFVDLISAYAVSQWFFEKKKFFVITLGIISLFFLTISWTIELMPFLNSQPEVFYSPYYSPLIAAIRTYSPPQANFVSIGNEKGYPFSRKKIIYRAKRWP